MFGWYETFQQNLYFKLNYKNGDYNTSIFGNLKENLEILQNAFD